MDLRLILARLAGEPDLVDTGNLLADTGCLLGSGALGEDPRWFELFAEFFVSARHQVHDDLLFFVKLVASSTEDAVFVRRRQPGLIPALADLVDWKQSFFLNLISQLPCTLAVSVCARNPLKGSSSMRAKHRVTKQVCAVPYTSKMDIKSTTNECAFPLVYYTVNDYDSNEPFLELAEKDHLCVELSVSVPSDSSNLPLVTIGTDGNLPSLNISSDSSNLQKAVPSDSSNLQNAVPSDSSNLQNAAETIAKITIEENSEPFPLPEGYEKIVLFQGAIPYSSLLDIYMQKGLAAQKQSRWGLSQPPLPKRNEYILMRGPQGKGQCQVAITEPPVESDLAIPKQGFFKSMSKIVNSIANKLEDVPDQDNVKPSSLVCSLTHVNMPWHAISSDLLEFGKSSSAKSQIRKYIDA